jgi:hypothetical protein
MPGEDDCAIGCTDALGYLFGKAGITAMENSMHKFGAILVVLATLGVAACQTPQQKVTNKEDMLSAAGFRVVPVNTPARQAALKQLPPNKLSREIRDGRVFYVYPDPMVCGCLYVGDQNAYGTYRANAFAKNLADEQAMTANEMSMDWGPWGGYPMGWYY